MTDVIILNYLSGNDIHTQAVRFGGLLVAL